MQTALFFRPPHVSGGGHRKAGPVAALRRYFTTLTKHVMTTFPYKTRPANVSGEHRKGGSSSTRGWMSFGDCRLGSPNEIILYDGAETHQSLCYLFYTVTYFALLFARVATPPNDALMSKFGDAFYRNVTNLVGDMGVT